MSDTLGSLAQDITKWLRGDLLDPDGQLLIRATINDSLEDIWMSMMRVQLARFLGLDSPVTFTLPSGAERVQLVSIPDPTVAPTTATISGGALGGRTYLIGYTYVTESGSETQLSPTATQIIAADNLCQVSPPASVSQAFGWNCYVSVTDNPALMALQNQQPLRFTGQFQEPTSGWVDYPVAQQTPPQVQGASQATPSQSPPPSENSTADNISWIKHLEIRTSDNVLRSWNQYDIDSIMMRRYASSQSSASEYQTYVWDLINGNRLEIRPSAGIQFQPRYFYIAKPRRLRYDPADIPYANIAGVHQFLIDKSISRLKLVLDEYISSTAFTQSAEGQRLQITLALSQETWNKDSRITPYMY